MSGKELIGEMPQISNFFITLTCDGSSAKTLCCDYVLYTIMHIWLSLQNKCRTADPDWQNWGRSSKLSFFVIYKFWQNCTAVRQVSYLILKTDDSYSVTWESELIINYNCTKLNVAYCCFFTPLKIYLHILSPQFICKFRYCHFAKCLGAVYLELSKQQL